MYRSLLFLFSLSILVTTTGCWDQRLLKDSSVVLATGLDLRSDKKITQSVLFPVSNKGPKITQTTTMVHGYGNTTKDARTQIEKKTAERFDSSKNRITLIGKDLAEQGVYSVLDSFYRDYNGSLGAEIAVINGDAKNALSIKPGETPLDTEYYPNLFKSTAQDGLIRIENIQSICTLMFSKGQDFLLPYIEILKKEKKAYISGTAMFNDDKMVGTLDDPESRMFLLLDDHKSKHGTFTLKVNKDKPTRDRNYITLNIIDLKRKLEIVDNHGKLGAKIKLDIMVGVNEYPSDHLYRTKEIEILNHDIQKEFSKIAIRTIKKMQEANCDGLGIGLRVEATKNEKWKGNWDTIYPTFPIDIKINAKILDIGIIN